MLCPIKTHHSSDTCALSCGQADQNWVIYIIYREKCNVLFTENLIRVTPLTHGVTSASELRYSHFGRIQQETEIVSEYDQEKPQSRTADKPEEDPHNNHKTPGKQTKQSNQLSLSLFPIKIIAKLEWT